MPSYIVHLAAATEVINREHINDKAYINSFLVGSMIADTMQTENKRYSHFWDEETYKLLERKPNLDLFLGKYGSKIREPFIRGYYGHLYMDYIFVDEYWSRNFTLLDKDFQPEKKYDLVKNIKLNCTGYIYKREEFLSGRLYYGDYDKLPPYILNKYNIALPSIDLFNKDNTSYMVEELNYDTSEEMLKAMLENVSDSIKNSSNFSIKKILDVFNIEEIYELIEKTINHLTEKN